MFMGVYCWTKEGTFKNSDFLAAGFARAKTGRKEITIFIIELKYKVVIGNKKPA